MTKTGPHDNGGKAPSPHLPEFVPQPHKVMAYCDVLGRAGLHSLTGPGWLVDPPLGLIHADSFIVARPHDPRSDRRCSFV